MRSARPSGEGAGAVDLPGRRDHGTEPKGEVPAKLTPEPAFVGAVLLVDLSIVRQALVRVRDDDFGDYRLRRVLAVARRLVAGGVRPDPVLVLAKAQADGDVTEPARITEFMLLLDTLVANVPVAASIFWYAEAVIESAVRRRMAEMVTRIGQAIEGESLDSLIELEAHEDAAVRELAARRTTTPTPLRAVP
jgi:replicative DNA helicase